MNVDLEQTTTHLQVGNTDVVLIQYESGHGKIIISNDDRDINVSYYWGAMGGDGKLINFLLKLNEGYFVGKLGTSTRGDFDIKKTMANIRKYISEEVGFKFYMDLEYNKTLRQKLNEIQNFCYDDRHFVELMQNLDDDYDLNPRNCKGYESEAKILIGSLTTEPWYFIVHKEHPTNLWLKEFLPKLKNKLKEL